VVVHVGAQDKLTWTWSASGHFSMSSAYLAMFLGQSSVLGAKELWKIKAQGKCLFFGWLVLLGRFWTFERLQRHSL
jgi:hypothetical protein